MKTFLPDFSVVSPAGLDEALDAMASNEGFRPLAGATDIMVYMESGALPGASFLNLKSIPELRVPPILADGLRLSALTTYQDVRSRPDITRRYPMLPMAAREIGVLAIQNVGTWAGNVANASPAADGVPALMAYDAGIELASRHGRRTVPLSEFYRGYKRMDLHADELITGIVLPAPPVGRREYFRKVGTRRLQAISKTLLAGTLEMDGDIVRDIRLVFASVAPYTLRARETECAIRGKALSPATINDACHALQDEISPIDDIRSNQRYRRRVSENLLRDFLQGENRASIPVS